MQAALAILFIGILGSASATYQNRCSNGYYEYNNWCLGISSDLNGDDDLSQACSDGATPVLDNEWTLIYKAMRFHNEWYVWSSRTDPRGCVFVKRTRYWLVGGVAACANPCPVVCKKPLQLATTTPSPTTPEPTPGPEETPAPTGACTQCPESFTLAEDGQCYKKTADTNKAAAFAAGCDEGSVVLNNRDELKAALKALNINYAWTDGEPRNTNWGWKYFFPGSSYPIRSSSGNIISYQQSKNCVGFAKWLKYWNGRYYQWKLYNGYLPSYCSNKCPLICKSDCAPEPTTAAPTTAAPTTAAPTTAAPTTAGTGITTDAPTTAAPTTAAPTTAAPTTAAPTTAAATTAAPPASGECLEGSILYGEYCYRTTSKLFNYTVAIGLCHPNETIVDYWEKLDIVDPRTDRDYKTLDYIRDQAVLNNDPRAFRLYWTTGRCSELANEQTLPSEFRYEFGFGRKVFNPANAPNTVKCTQANVDAGRLCAEYRFPDGQALPSVAVNECGDPCPVLCKSHVDDQTIIFADGVPQPPSQ